MVLGDGAPWIWNIADSQFPDATQIVDPFHVKQHLSNVANAIWGAGSTNAKSWSEACQDELDQGHLDALLTALASHATTSDDARKCAAYLDHNRHRLDYPAFHARGFCTSTGVVEAGCKTAIGTRLRRAGMHWSSAGADAIIALRCCRLSGRFEDFWERRALRAA